MDSKPPLKELTDDRRDLYLIEDPKTRELRYREMYYEELRRANEAVAKNLRLTKLIARYCTDGDDDVFDEMIVITGEWNELSKNNRET